MIEKPVKIKKDRKLTKLDILSELFIKKGGPKWGPKDFPRECAAVKRLTTTYPDFDFFYSLTEYLNKFNSLLGMTGVEMKSILDKKYKTFIYEKESKPINYELSDTPVITIDKSDKKPDNMLEFMK